MSRFDELRAMCPGETDWSSSWSRLLAMLPASLEPLHHCDQDPVFHAEGDVGIHTGMVLEALCAMPAFRALSEEERLVVWLACLFHDIAKPTTTKEIDGKLTARGHSRKGAIMVRELLWAMEAPWQIREAVAGLVLHHQVPFFLVERDDHERLAITVSQSARCDLLALVAEADARGRVCKDQQRLIDNCALFLEACTELGCAHAPYQFDGEHTRFLFFQDRARNRFAPGGKAELRSDVVLLSGLPATGKDSWAREHGGECELISLDDIRETIDVEHGAPQGEVIAFAREQARVALRKGARIVWNATSLVRSLRAPVISLAASYGARVRIVCLEGRRSDVLARNRARERPVPEHAIERMLSRWEFPDATEAHAVDVVLR